MENHMHNRHWSALALILVALPAAAQQSGALVGKVTGKDGKMLSGVRIEATGNTLPQPRRTITGENGEFRLPFLPPGDYVLTFTHPAKAAEKRSAVVALQQNTTINVAMADAASAGATVEIVSQASLIDATSAELKTSITSEVMNALPVGQDYRDLVKLIPGVQYSQDAVRAPSAGGSGQDNIHQFDGVNVNLPLFGTLSATPSSHDIDQIAIVKGGANAVGFNRSAGYSMNSISKSGTNTFTGELAYTLLPSSQVARRTTVSAAQYERDIAYTWVNGGGPILKDKLYFFASYYRPTEARKNSSNLYGVVPDYKSTRDEFFGKLTYAPLSTLLIHASLRTSEQTYNSSGVASSATAPSVSTGGKVKMDIGIIEASWNITPSSFINFKYTSLANKNQDRPDTLSSVHPALDGSVGLDVNALDTQGQFSVPLVRTGTTANDLAFNAFANPIISRYGYLSPTTGLMTGGGVVGGYNQINNQDFFRKNYQLSYDATFGASITHEVHVGFQWWKDSEDLLRTSNGWGVITAPYNTNVPAGLPNAGTRIYFAAAVQQQGVLGVPTIHSEYVAQDIELNDKIRWNKFTFNVGLLMSNDKLYGQGLRENASTASGWELANGNRYLEKEIKFSDTFQPRLGVTWNYAAEDTVYGNYAKYVPAASSLPRAASWARNKAATVNAYFGQTGNFLASQLEQSSTGKLFTPGMKPRQTDEYLIGTTKDLGDGWSGRLSGRYRYSCNFWEDTMNNSRVLFNPPAGTPNTLYIPNLTTQLATLGGGSDFSYVVAQLDNSFTKYYEVSAEAEWRGSNAYFRGSYVWSHYYGNFDQDNSTAGAGNDSNIFIGSSNIADDFGKQLWNYKYGNLTGDRRHQVKLYGYYSFPWAGRLGAYAVYQSGQPWQYSNYLVYAADRLAQASTSTSDTNRYSEPAGSRVTRPHYQLDLNYTQTFWKKKALTVDGTVEVFNVFNRQTGYNPAVSVNGTSAALLGLPTSFFAPRRAQFGVRFLF
jgi:hypothetical protein